MSLRESLTISSSENKRVDLFTREAIDDIQSSFFDVNSFYLILQRLSRYLKTITHAQSIACFLPADYKRVFCESGGKCCLLQQDLSIAYESSVFDREVFETWLSGDNVQMHLSYFNQPIANHIKRVFLHEDGVNNLLIVPLHVTGEIACVFLLAARYKNFSEQVLHRIKPVLSATESLLAVGAGISRNSKVDRHDVFKSLDIEHFVQSSMTGVIIIDFQKIIVHANPVSANILCGSAGAISGINALLGREISEFLPAYNDLFKWSYQTKAVREGKHNYGPVVWKQFDGINVDGDPLKLNLSVSKFHIRGDEFSIVQLHDVTEDTISVENYKATVQQFAIVNQSVPVAILHIDAQWNCQLCNPHWERLTGLDQEQTLGRGWINGLHPQNVASTLEQLHQHLISGNDLHLKTMLKHINGGTRWVEFSASLLRSENNEVQGFVVTCNDITEHYIAQEKLREIAQFDALTGLTNRKTFQDRLEQAMLLSERTLQSVCLFFVDLDGFKDVNDSLGHDFGDKVLQLTAERLTKVLRKSDTIARFGGDEFVVLLGGEYKSEDVLGVARKVIDAIAQSLVIDSREITLTASLGVAQGSADQYSASDLLKHADSALYRAKNLGKNRVELASHSSSQITESRLDLLNELRLGLRKNNYILHYQPIFCTQTRRVTGVEALLRFKRVTDIIISPSEFMHLLEDSGLIIPVGRWVIAEACRQFAEWKQTNLVSDDFILSMNVSSKEFLDNDFVDLLLAQIQRYQINPQNLLIEITESTMISRTDDVKQEINFLKSKGIRFAVDDFGTGYSSLSYLQKFPMDVVKIDKSFIDDLSDDSNDIIITRAIIALAASLNLDIIAEGVENLQTLEKLFQLGASNVQGYYLSEPLSSTDLICFFEQMGSLAQSQAH